MTSTITLDLVITNTVVGLLLPILVDLLAKWRVPAVVKVVINLFLSAVAGVLTPLVVADHVAWRPVLLSVLQAFLVSAVSHRNLLGPLGLTGDGGLILKLIPGGIGNAKHPKPGAVADPLAA